MTEIPGASPLTPGAKRYSHERAAVAQVLEYVGEVGGTQIFSGTRPDNRVNVPDFDLLANQYIQFGDLRLENERVRVVIEFESGGGVGNLVKYWPLLRTGLTPPPLLLIHVFQVASSNDFIAHRELWKFLIARMREDLENYGVEWGASWAATLHTYRRESLNQDMLPIGDIVKSALATGNLTPMTGHAYG